MKPASLSKERCPAEPSCHKSVRAAGAFFLRVLASSLFLGLPFLAVTASAQSQLRWADLKGVVLQDGNREVCWGWNGAGDSLRLGFPAANIIQRLLESSLKRPEGQRLLLAYDAQSPDGVSLRIERRLQQKADRDGIVLFETFSLTPTRPLTNDIEVEIPFALSIEPGPSASSSRNWHGSAATCPLKNGWARSFPLSPGETRVEYRLGSFLTGNETPQLALPLVRLRGQGGAAAVFADPRFSTLFSLRTSKGQIEGALRFRYAASRVPISVPEARTFAIWLPNNKRSANEFPAAVDAWFRLMLPEVPPGPKWLHEIAMVDYDFLSDDGQGWERDLRALASWLKPNVAKLRSSMFSEAGTFRSILH